MYYVYVLKSKKDSSLYIGRTSDLRRRMQEHNDGRSKYTKYKRPWMLIYYEAYRSKRDAIARERQLKEYKSAYGHLKKRINASILDDT